MSFTTGIIKDMSLDQLKETQDHNKEMIHKLIIERNNMDRIINTLCAQNRLIRRQYYLRGEPDR